MNTYRKSERGQIVVIFVIALVALLALTALAIDGGMILSDRRVAQGAADAASLAGTGAASRELQQSGVIYANFTCTNSAVETAVDEATAAAISRAAGNNYPALDEDLADNHGVEVVCNNDPTHFQKYIDVKTVITAQTNTSFAHLFNNGPMKNTVTAVARLYPQTNVAYGFAIASLGSTCENNEGGVDFVGGADMVVIGGGIFSNSCFTFGGSGSVDSDGGIAYAGGEQTYDCGPGTDLNPCPVHNPAQMPIQTLPEPPCPAPGATGTLLNSTNGGTINPGNYDEIRLGNNETLTMNPGLYCIYGGITINGGTWNAGSDAGDGVTIFIRAVDGGGNNPVAVSVTGSTNHIYAAKADHTASIAAGAVPGVLFQMKSDLDATISLSGNGDSNFAGLIYAPSGNVELTGTSGHGGGQTYNTQVIAGYVNVGGTASVQINFDNERPVDIPSYLNLQR